MPPVETRSAGSRRRGRAGAPAVTLWVVAVLVCAVSGRPAAASRELADFPVESQYVDWQQGTVMAFGAGEPSEDDARLAAALQTSRGAAFSQARSRLAAAAGAIRFSSEETVTRALEKIGGGGAARRFRSLLQAAHPLLVFQRRDGSSGIWLSMPLYGPGGLGEVFTGVGDGPSARGASLSLLVDVSQRVVRPCLWPKVVDAEGRVLLDLPGLAAAGALPPEFGIVRSGEDEAATQPGSRAGAAPPRLSGTLHANGSDIVVDATEWAEIWEDRGPVGLLVLVERNLAGAEVPSQTLP